MLARGIVALAAMITPGMALAAETATFTIADVTLTATLPAGYCLPKNNDKLIADTLATGDPQNLTLATFIRCDRQGNAEGPGNDYMLIKSPNAAIATRTSRPELLSALETEFGKAEWQADGDNAKRTTADAAQSLSDALNTEVDIQGSMAPRGVDKDCAYLGGTFQVNGGGVSYPIIGGGCITSAGDKVVAVYTYDDPGKGGGVTGKMRAAHDVAMSIKPAP